MIKVNNKFDLTEEVYLRTDPEQLIRIVTGISLNGHPDNPNIGYELSQGPMQSFHYDYEISRDKIY